MHPQKRLMLWINVLGGVAVLGSYAHGLWTHPAGGAELWGGVPEALRPVYTGSMLLAAAGYFAFTYLLLFRLDPAARVAGRFRFGLFNVLYAGILAPSVLWMPLTFAMLRQPGAGLWLAIRLTLALVGLASLGLLGALLGLEPRRPAWACWLAVAGSLAFCTQTALLDALVWPVLFLR
jgi:hypothetical protein